MCETVIITSTGTSGSTGVGTATEVIGGAMIAGGKGIHWTAGWGAEGIIQLSRLAYRWLTGLPLAPRVTTRYRPRFTRAVRAVARDILTLTVIAALFNLILTIAVVAALVTGVTVLAVRARRRRNAPLVLEPDWDLPAIDHDDTPAPPAIGLGRIRSLVAGRPVPPPAVEARPALDRVRVQVVQGEPIR